MKGKSITFSKNFVYALIIVATLILCVATFSFIGVNSLNFEASAEATEIVTTVTSTIDDANLTVEGLGTHYFKDDAVFTITSNVNAGALELIGVNATYTTGDNAGTKVTLAKDGNVYALYGVTGDFVLSGEWVAKSFTATWTHTNLTLFNQDDTAFDEGAPIYYGIGIPAAEMPYAKGDHSGSNSYNASVWSVTGTLSNGSSYTENHIPANAISAKCTMSARTAANVKKYVEDTGTHTLATNTTAGVSFAPTSEPYDLQPTNYKWFKAGALDSSQINSGSNFWKNADSKAAKGLGFFVNSCTQAGICWYLFTIPIHFDGELKQNIASGKYGKVTVEITAGIQVGFLLKKSGGAGRTVAYMDATKSMMGAPSIVTSGKGLSSATNYPVSFSASTVSGGVNTNYASATTITSGTLNQTLVYEGDKGANGFVVGFRTAFYDNHTLSNKANNGNYTTDYNEHYAFLNSLTYTITADNVQQTYKLNLDSNNPDGVESELVSTRDFDADFNTIQTAPWNFDEQGYNFKGWSTEKGGEIISDSLKVLEGQTETTYYANWEKKNYAYVTAEDYTDGTNNVSEVLSTEIKEHGTSVTIPNRNTGDKYIGFNYDGLSPSGVNEGDVLTLTGSTRIGYNYSLLSREVVFDDKEVVYNQSIALKDLTTIADNPLVGSSRVVGESFAYTIGENLYDIDKVVGNVLESGVYTATATISVDIQALSGEIITLSTSYADTATITILKANIEGFSVSDATYTYDSEQKTLSVIGDKTQFDEEVTVENGSISATDAGVYALNAIVKAGDNYNDLTLSATLTIEKLLAEIEWPSLTYVYDSNEVDVTPTIANVCKEGEVSLQMSGDFTQINVGNYTATISAISNANYLLPEEGLTKDWSITARPLSVSKWVVTNGIGDVVTTFVYDGKSYTASAVIDNAVTEISLVYNNESNVDAGSYTATVALLDSETNYTLEEGSFEYAIAPRLVEVTWDYVIPFTYDGNVKAVGYTFDNKVGTDAVIFTDSNLSKTDAGSYTATISSVDNPNYALPEGGITQSWEIQKRVITVSWSGSTSVGYNGNYQYPSSTVSNVVAGQELYFIIEISNGENTIEKKVGGTTFNFNRDTTANVYGEPIDAGSYTINYSEVVYSDAEYTTLNENYTIVVEEKSFNITPKRLIASGVWYYDDDVQYVGALNYRMDAYTLTSSYNSAWLVTREDTGAKDVAPQIIYTNNVQSNAGTYETTMSIDSNNYILDEDATTRISWEIKPLPLSFTWTDTVEYTYDATEKSVTATISNAIEGDDVTLQMSGDKATDAGSYISEIKGVSTANYLLPTTNLSKEWSIKKATIEGITLVGGNYTYNATKQKATLNGTATQFGDEVEVDLSVESDGISAGTHVYTAVVTSGNNYEALTLTASVVIAKSEITGITFVGADYTYDGTEKVITISKFQTQFNEPISVSYSGGETFNKATNAGEYPIVATIKGGDNYLDLTLTANLNIAKANVSGLKFSNKTVTYDKTAHAISIEGTSNLSGEITYTINGEEGNSAINAGIYTVVATIAESANFNAGTISATLTIEKADISDATLENATYTYSKSAYLVQVVGYSDTYGALSYTINGVEGNSATNVGTYSVVASIEESANYNALTLTATLTIEKATIEGISLVGGTYTYDGEEKKVSLSKESTQYGDEVEVIVTGESAINAGSYEYSAVVSAGDNYENLTLSAEIVINKADISGVSLENATYTYSKSAYSTQVVGYSDTYGALSYVINGVEGNSATNAGTYSVVASIEESANYNALTLTATLTIEKAIIENVSVSDATYTYDKEEKTIAVVGTTTQYGDEVSVENGSVSGTNVGTYDLSATITSQNYEPLTLTATLTIEKATIEGVSLVGGTYTYDGEEKKVSLSKESTQYGDEVEVTVTGESAINAGSYEYSAVVSAGDNYETLTLSAEIVINKADISGVSLENATYTYSKSAYSTQVVGYSDAYGALSYVINGVEGNSATNAGTYSVVASIEESVNYNALTLTATLTIEKAIIENVSVSDATYNYDKEEKTIAVVGTTTQYGDEVSVENGSVSGTNVGTYDLSATITSQNYETLTLTATLTIEKATIEGISLVGGTYTYDGEEKKVSLSKESTQYGDEVEVTVTGESAINAGSYEYSAIVSAGDNYENLTLSAEIVINKATIEGITLMGATYVYDGTVKSATLSGSETQFGDSVSISLTEESALNAGTYLTTVVVTAGDNYETLTLSAEVVIEKRTISVVGYTDGVNTYGANDTISYTYSKKEITLSPVYGDGNVIAGDEVNFVISGNSAINAGKNTLKVALEENENYQMNVLSKAWSIAPKMLEVAWTGEREVDYNGDAHGVTATLRGIITGDVVNLVTTGTMNVNAGSYTAKAVSVDNDNYTVSKSECKYVINKAKIEGVNILSLSTIYEGKPVALSINKTETQFGDALSVSYKYVLDGKTFTSAVEEIGVYNVTATISAGNNYETLVLSATLNLKVVEIKSEEGAKVEIDGGFAPGTALKTRSKLYGVNESSEYEVAYSSTERIALAYEVTLMSGEVEVTPEGAMVLSLQIPEEIQEYDFRIVALLGNETVEVEYTVVDGNVVIETDALGTYLFIVETSFTEKLIDALPYILIGLVALLAVIAVIVIIVIRTKKRNIKFVVNGVELKNELGNMTAKYGQKVSLPTPEIGGMYFEGCYLDPECTKKAKVSDLRDDGKQFYSKSVKHPCGNIKVQQAFLDTVKFGGWYLDEECTQKANITKMGRKDVTLYAKWNKKNKKPNYKVYPWEK